jgi:membrane-associated protease RseP (regulator of RpoE activity)
LRSLRGQGVSRGRWAVTAIYKVLKKPLTPETEEKIHGTGFLVLMMLVVVITVLDVGKFGK